MLLPLSAPVRLPAGKVESKEHVLDERDGLYCDLRHKHFAAASLAISSQLDDFRARSAKMGARTGLGGMELRNMGKLIRSLPQYRCVCVVCVRRGGDSKRGQSVEGGVQFFRPIP